MRFPLCVRARVDALQWAHGSELDGAQLLVEYERERTMPGWVPRRLGTSLSPLHFNAILP